MKPTKEELENLYLSQRLTTRVIGAQFGVSKTQVLRWLRADAIERRPTNRGLISRGIIEPTADELFNMIHVEHLGYKGVATRYGVDTTAVPYWLKKHGIKKPSIWATRYAGNAPDINNEPKMVELYTEGASTRQLADIFSVSSTLICKRLRANGVKLRLGGFGGKRFTCNDGHTVMSIYEQRVDNWLHFHGFAHEVEPKLPFNQRCRGDFLVNGIYIEIWGVVGSPTYSKRRQYKTEQYRKHGLQVIDLQVHHFDMKRKRTFEKVLQEVLQPQSSSL